MRNIRRWRSARPTETAPAVDLAFTVPAYLVIFTVIFAFVDRWPYATWGYVVATYLVLGGAIKAVGRWLGPWPA